MRPQSRSRSAIGLAAAAVALIAWAHAPLNAPARPQLASRGAECSGIEAPPPARHRRLILGGVAFQSYTRPGWEEGDRVPVARWPGGRLFAKIGLWRRGPDPVVLSVADPVRIRGWSVNGTNTELELPPCGDRRWRVFPGGLLIPRPRRCVTLRVQVAEETAKVPFGLGVSC